MYMCESCTRLILYQRRSCGVFALGALCIRIVVVDNCREEIGVSNMVRGIRNLNMVVYLINSRLVVVAVYLTW